MKNLNKVFLLSCIVVFFQSCKVDCAKIAEIDRFQQCLIIVGSKPDSTSLNMFIIEGKSIKTGKDTVYNEQNRWFCTYYDKINRGDTIIKRKGQLTFSIHKKDSILTFPWECEGKLYK